MKGPSHRLKFDFRRRWECPVCHARVRTTGAVTSMFCSCGQTPGARNIMQLTFDGEPMLRWRDQVAVATTATAASETIQSLESESATEEVIDVPNESSEGN